jgi:hypothetical protein
MVSTLLSVSVVLALASSLAAAVNVRDEKSLWQPKVNETWQIVLRATIDKTNLQPSFVDIWDIDLYENTAQGTDSSTISYLKEKMNAKVICYFSAGTWEEVRTDAGKFNVDDIGNLMEGWPEYWLNTNSQSVREIMKARIAVAAQMGCDAIDPDNVDGFVSPSNLDYSSISHL